ncbi:MAG: hypothetical protein ACFFCC_19420 [Promethearchaeota archaeon]
MIGIYTLIEKKHSLIYEKFIDITPYLANNSITEYYGKYFVNIDIEGTDYRDKFIISEFYLQSDTFIQAGINDTTAWLTNPAKFDTDDDGWSDYKEIYSKNTNPLSPDTDADHIWDPYDRDPHKDVMLKITPISASAPSAYNLQIVMAFTIDGSGDQYYIPTLKQKADVYEDPLWTAYYDGTHGSSTELHYYMNINDDKRLPNIYDLMRFDLELWHVDRYWGFIKLWDSKLHSGFDFYNIKTPGHSETLKIEKMDAAEQVIYEAKIKVETIGIEKTNTIAIYETNGSVFNDHYQEQERMNIIQLYVNDSGSGTPFEEGLNTIVIPTSLFTETVFNAYVQNETLNETKIYSSDEDIFKFISVGRDGNTEQACDEIDFVIIRFNISSQDAMEVLNLMLECLVNETTNETAIVYSYVSTKENYIKAIMMNLPYTVLGLIPWYGDFENSPTGSKPVTYEDWFWAPLISLGNVFIGIFITIGMAFVALFMIVLKFVIEIFMDFLPIVQYILLLVIRVAVLIFAFILLAISLIAAVIMNLTVGAIAMLFALVIGGAVKFGPLFVEMKIFDVIIRMDTLLNWGYVEFLGLNFPYLTDRILINNTIIQETKTSIIDSYSEDNFLSQNQKLDLFKGNYSSESNSDEEIQLPFQYDEHAPELSLIGLDRKRGYSNELYCFKILYCDVDGDAPSSNYGVKLLLLSPKGVLQEYEMITNDESPNYQNGVIYECTIGDNINEKLKISGEWHYYFIAEDTSQLKSALLEDDGTAFDGPLILLDISSFDIMFGYFTLFCGTLPMFIFAISGALASKGKHTEAIILGVFGALLGSISGTLMLGNIFGFFPTFDNYGSIDEVPFLTLGTIEIDKYSALWAAFLACVLIVITSGLVLTHEFDFSKVWKIKSLITWTGFDIILVAFNILNQDFLNLNVLQNLLTILGVISSITGLIISSITYCRYVYGFNWIKKNKDGSMNRHLRYKTVHADVKAIPKIYTKFVGLMSLAFLVLLAITSAERFGGTID